MAPTEGRVAKPEQPRDCRCGTPILHQVYIQLNQIAVTAVIQNGNLHMKNTAY